VTLLAIFGSAITLSGILKYQVTVKASATIRPIGELRLVQVGTDGSIKKIMVQVNQAVKKGDIITYMNNSHDQTKKRQLQTSIEQAKLL
jgi:HlyD family secretion protein